jgi:D-amino acid aminotransferase
MVVKACCWLNGKFVDVAKARISPLDRGFLFGEGLFETWRTYRGKAYGLPEHLERMAASAKKIGIEFDPSEPWAQRSADLARRNGMLDRDGAIRMTITRGHGPVSLLVAETAEPTTLMLYRPLEPNLADVKASGVAIWPFSIGSGVCERQRQIKTLNYLPAILARAEAKKHGCYEAIYHTDGSRNGHGQVVLEGTTSNVFAVKDGIVRTAPISAGLLPGVTRHKVLKLARTVAKVKEETFTVQDLADADEAFITGSGIEVIPVVRVAKKKIGNGRPGPVSLEIQRRYREQVARALGLEIDELGA